MVSGKIKFYSPEDVNDFVRLASKCDFDIDIQQRAAVLDGKSIEGLLALQLQEELTCTLHETMDKTQAFRNEISKYIVIDFK